MLRVMTPLWGTKTPSAPVGPSRVGTEEPPGRCFPALCGAAWGGYGAAWAAAVPRTGNAAFMVLHGTRVTKHGFPRPCGDSRESNPKPDQRVFHETRDTKHESRLLRFPTHDFPPFPTISRHFPAPPTPLRRSSVHAPSAFLGQPPGLPRRAALPGHCFPARCGAAMERLWRGMGGGRPPHRQHGLSCSPAVRYFFWSEPGLPTMVFTKHETRNTAFMLFTNHESRNMVFPCPSGDSKESNAKPDQRVFHETRNTRHESRLFSRMLRPSGGEKCRLVTTRPGFEMQASDYASRFRSSTAPNPRRSSARPRCRSSEPTRFRGESTG